MQKLILWDIDSTLLTTSGIAAAAMREALHQRYGSAPGEDRSIYAGKTDRQIILETFPHLTPDAVEHEIEAFGTIYLQLLRDRHIDVQTQGRVLPGAREALEYFHGRVYQGVLTGNIASVAHYKLETLDLLQFIDLEASAFGSDHHDRPALLPIALERAAKRYHRMFLPEDVVVVGDTPNDIACGQAGGARTVAVATGIFGADELRSYQPDLVLLSLDAPGALESILA